MYGLCSVLLEFFPICCCSNSYVKDSHCEYLITFSPSMYTGFISLSPSRRGTMSSRGIQSDTIMSGAEEESPLSLLTTHCFTEIEIMRELMSESLIN